jgi:hypothetical protein
MSPIPRSPPALLPLPAIAVALFALVAAAPAPPPPSSGSSSAPPLHHTRAHFFVGEVVEIVPGENRFSVRETLRDGSPKVTFFTADAETTVFRGKEPAAFSDLHVNDHVTIKYSDASGTRKTVSIRITPTAKPNPAPAPTAPTKPSA